MKKVGYRIAVRILDGINWFFSLFKKGHKKSISCAFVGEDTELAERSVVPPGMRSQLSDQRFDHINEQIRELARRLHPITRFNGKMESFANGTALIIQSAGITQHTYWNEVWFRSGLKNCRQYNKQGSQAERGPRPVAVSAVARTKDVIAAAAAAAGESVIKEIPKKTDENEAA